MSVRRQVLRAKDVARRLRGFSAFGFSASWDYPPSERDAVRRLIHFLEDRRALFNPLAAEVEDHVLASVSSMREQCTKTLGELGEGSRASECVRAIRASCRRFADEPYPTFPDMEERRRARDFGPEFWMRRANQSAGFFTALGELRAATGQQIAVLSAAYEVDVEGDLASIIPAQEDEV